MGRSDIGYDCDLFALLLHGRRGRSFFAGRIRDSPLGGTFLDSVNTAAVVK
jgi:hypothetical protein